MVRTSPSFLHQEGLLVQEVRVREVDHPLALREDCRAGDDEVELVLGEVTEDGVEAGVLVLALEAELAGDLVDQFDLETLVVGRAALLQRRIGDVDPYDQRARLERVDLGAVAAAASAPIVVVIVTAGDESGARQQEQRANPQQ